MLLNALHGVETVAKVTQSRDNVATRHISMEQSGDWSKHTSSRPDPHQQRQ